MLIGSDSPPCIDAGPYTPVITEQEDALVNSTLMRIASLWTCALCVVGLSALTSAASAVSALAESDPMVVIVQDVTATSQCYHAFEMSPGTVHAAVTKSACRPGAIVRTFHVPLSVVRARHLAYILLPSHDAPRSKQLETVREISALMSATQLALLPPLQYPSQSAINAVPASCGNNYQESSGWTASYGDHPTFTGYIDWSQVANCTQVVIGQSGIEQTSGQQNYWSQNSYYNTTWSLYCRTIPTSNYTTYTPLSNSLQPNGHYFFEQTSDGQVGGGCNPFANYYRARIGSDPLS